MTVEDQPDPLKPPSPSSTGPYQPIDVFRVIETIANPDPEVRNHLVTDTYWEMSQVLDGLLHGSLKDRSITNANWFTVATWAIATVGRNIRTNELPRRLDQMLPSGLRAQATPWVLSMRSRSGRRVQRALGHGQILVFASTMLAALEFVQQREQRPIEAVLKRLEGREEVRFPDLNLKTLRLTRQETVDQLRGFGQEPLEMSQVMPLVRPRNELTTSQRNILRQIAERSEGALSRNRNQRSSALKEFLKLLNSEEEIDGLDLLRRLVELLVDSESAQRDLKAAFAAYGRASRSTDADEVAQEILRGNLIIAAVEQVLLDRPVTTVVDHVPREFEDWFELNASVWGERLLRVPRALGRLGVSRRFRRSQALARDAWARLLTDQVLVLALPTETLRIGRDIPLRSSDGEFFPAQLACLTQPEPGPRSGPDVDRLSTDELFSLFDRSRGDGIRTGAWDWRRFDERMNFAANLLRSRQQDQSLFWRPYNEEDRARLRRGQVPIRTGDAFEQAIAGPTFDWLESIR